jgi:hypothetical protein
MQNYYNSHLFATKYGCHVDNFAVTNICYFFWINNRNFKRKLLLDIGGCSSSDDYLNVCLPRKSLWREKLYELRYLDDRVSTAFCSKLINRSLPGPATTGKCELQTISPTREWSAVFAITYLSIMMLLGGTSFSDRKMNGQMNERMKHKHRINDPDTYAHMMVHWINVILHDNERISVYKFGNSGSYYNNICNCTISIVEYTNCHRHINLFRY